MNAGRHHVHVGSLFSAPTRRAPNMQTRHMLMIVSEWHRIAYMLTVQAEAEANEHWEVL